MKTNTDCCITGFSRNPTANMDSLASCTCLLGHRYSHLLKGKVLLKDTCGFSIHLQGKLASFPLYQDISRFTVERKVKVVKVVFSPRKQKKLCFKDIS